MAQKNKKGFTLIEMLVYLAIFMIVASASVSFLLSLNKFVAQYVVETELYRSNTNTMEQILLSLRQADIFNGTDSVLNDGANGALAINSGATTTVFARNGSDLNLSINGIEYGNLLADSVSITDFTVYEYDLARGQFIRVRLTLSATINGVTKSTTVYGGAVIRGAL